MANWWQLPSATADDQPRPHLQRPAYGPQGRRRGGSGIRGSGELPNPLPAPLFKAMGHFIEGHPQWDQYRLLQAALSGFLLQQGVKERTLTRRYIGSMFGRA